MAADSNRTAGEIRSLEKPICGGRVSVVIPSYNRADAAIRCAKSVFASDWPDVEVVIVDDCSEKCDVAAEVEAALGRRPDLKVIRHETNRKVSAARNTGARASSGEYLLFVDDDNILDPPAIGRLAAAIGSGKCGIAALLSVNVSPDGAKKVWATSFTFNRWTSVPRNENADVAYTDDFAKGCAGRTFGTWYSPNGYMTRRETFERIGGFDEWFGFWMEESDFCMRAMAAGVKTLVVADAVTWHHHYNDTGDMVLRRLGSTTWRAYRLQRNRLVFAWRHYRLWHVLSIGFVFAPLITACYALVALRRRRLDIALAFVAGCVSGTVRILWCAATGNRRGIVV